MVLKDPDLANGNICRIAATSGWHILPLMLLISSVLPGIGSSGPSPKDPISYCSEKLIVFKVRDQDVDAKHFIYLFIYLAPRMSFNAPDG